DALYLAVSEGRRYPVMEHWLPLFYEKLDTVFDYLSGFRIVIDHTVREAAEERSKLVFDRQEKLGVIGVLQFEAGMRST
ncbi:hypothetical protein ACC677_38455, partial [Rhizobium ruizarguesonis]